MKARSKWFSQILLILLVAVVCRSRAIAQDGSGKESENQSKIYLIGNSLTWDTVPSRLDGEVRWHVDCGKNLQYIHEHPQEPCVKTSTLWPAALKEEHYDFVCMQPHYGTTIAEDVATISKWIEMQPKAVFIIHTGWARSASLREEFSDKDPAGTLTHSSAYFDALIAELTEKFPGREFRPTHATNILNSIADDVKGSKAPVQDITELYRDAIHMTTTSGRYLMHNAMRRALGQPISTKGFEKVPESMRDYLNGKLKQVL